MMAPLATADQVVAAALQLGGFAVLGALVAGAVAVGYRWGTREQVPFELALLAGLAGVAVYVNASAIMGRGIGGGLATTGTALFNAGAFLFGAVGAVAGHRMGDTFGRDVLNDGMRDSVDEEVSRLVSTVGRVTVVDLPQDVDDVVGYDPVSKDTREAIAGTQLVFPGNLTLSTLDSRIRSRLKTDYGVGTVDLELAADGTVEYLAVGSRAAGIGPTLPPATNAVALRADPASDASTGDVVQVWETDPMRRVLTGELRGVAGDVVTVAINSADTPKVDPTRTYRLVTLPVEDRPAREFASLLRSADESYTSVTVEAGSPLHGMPVGALDLTVVGIEPDEGEPVAVPSRGYVLAPGESVLAIGVCDALRKLEQAAKPLDPSIVPGTTEPSDDHPVAGEDAVESAATASRDESPAPSSVPASDPESGQEQVQRDRSGRECVDDNVEEIPPSSAEPEETSGEAPVARQADDTAFEQLKEEYDRSGGWEETDDESEDEPIERVAEGSGPLDTGSVDAQKSEASSFEDLKAQFEDGETDWDDDDTANDTSDDEPSGVEPADGFGSEDLVNLDEADITFDDEEREGGDHVDELDDGLTDGFDESDEFGGDFDESDEFGDGFDEEVDDEPADFDEETEDISSGDEEDDLSALTLDDTGEDLFEDDPFEDDDLFEDDPFGETGDSSDDSEEDGSEDNSENEDSRDDLADGEAEDDETPGEDSEDSAGGGGGGSTFAQLKEEFESGEADWEDEISDSPGGDMRLDE